jgi:hypothetical protein
MRATERVRSGLLATTLAVAALAVGALALAAEPADTDEAKVQVLRGEVDALQQALTRLESTDPAGQRQAMREHWTLVQEHMKSVRRMPGMDARNCVDWMMMGPGMMSSDARGDWWANCPLLGHGLDIGNPAATVGGSTWALPAALSPGDYRRRMQAYLRTMHSQLAAIAAEDDPAKRAALMREHYETMYRDMQTLRGMEWMWGPASGAPLPDAGATATKLFASYCGQCHSPPSPALHTRVEWQQTLQRMRGHIAAQSGPMDTGVRVPSAEDFDVLSQYLDDHAAAEPGPRARD